MPDEENRTMPEWVPDGADKRFFTTSVMQGVKSGEDNTISHAPRPKRRELSLQEYKDGVLAGDRTILGRAITLIESNADAHFEKAQALLSELIPHAGKAFRIGITGVPGAGKSSFIETFGSMLCEEFGKKVAVLAVDPSSSVTGGSILGDKTRREKLSRNTSASSKVLNHSNFCSARRWAIYPDFPTESLNLQSMSQASCTPMPVWAEHTSQNGDQPGVGLFRK